MTDPQTNTIDVDQLKGLLQNCDASAIFDPVKNKYSLDKFLRDEYDMVFPREESIGVTLKWNKERTKILKIEDRAYVVPLIENLKSLLSNDNFRSFVKARDENQSNTYRTVFDGSYMRENEFFKKFPSALAIILYYDEVLMASPIGSAAKKHKMGMFYWTLGITHHF